MKTSTLLYSLIGLVCLSFLEVSARPSRSPIGNVPGPSRPTNNVPAPRPPTDNVPAPRPPPGNVPAPRPPSGNVPVPRPPTVQPPSCRSSVYNQVFEGYLLVSILNHLITARKRSLGRLCFHRCLSVPRDGVSIQHPWRVYI